MVEDELEDIGEAYTDGDDDEDVLDDDEPYRPWSLDTLEIERGRGRGGAMGGGTIRSSLSGTR